MIFTHIDSRNSRWYPTFSLCKILKLPSIFFPCSETLFLFRNSSTMLICGKVRNIIWSLAFPHFHFIYVGWQMVGCLANYTTATLFFFSSPSSSLTPFGPSICKSFCAFVFLVIDFNFCYSTGKICFWSIQEAPSWNPLEMSSWKDEAGEKDGNLFSVLWDTFSSLLDWCSLKGTWF